MVRSCLAVSLCLVVGSLVWGDDKPDPVALRKAQLAARVPEMFRLIWPKIIVAEARKSVADTGTCYGEPVFSGVPVKPDLSAKVKVIAVTPPNPVIGDTVGFRVERRIHIGPNADRRFFIAYCDQHHDPGQSDYDRSRRGLDGPTSYGARLAKMEDSTPAQGDPVVVSESRGKADRLGEHRFTAVLAAFPIAGGDPIILDIDEATFVVRPAVPGN